MLHIHFGLAAAVSRARAASLFVSLRRIASTAFCCCGVERYVLILVSADISAAEGHMAPSFT
jgi:hypothetical protein